MKMLWIGLLTTFQLWGSIVAQQQTENIRTTEHPYTTDLYSVFLTALKDLRACKSLTLCELVERFRIPLQDFSKFSSSTSERRKGTYYDEVKPRSYYNTYGAPAAPAHTYVPAFLGFDPISILASLAFLAFLIQSFVSLFDRSRSIIPTIVSSRQSLEASIQDIAERVFRAMDRYVSFHDFSNVFSIFFLGIIKQFSQTHFTASRIFNYVLHAKIEFDKLELFNEKTSEEKPSKNTV